MSDQAFLRIITKVVASRNNPLTREKKLIYILLFFENMVEQTALKLRVKNFFGEFDLGSERTLVACLIHASRAELAVQFFGVSSSQFLWTASS